MNAKDAVRVVNAERSIGGSNFTRSLEVHAQCVRGVYAWLAYDVDLCQECDHKRSHSSAATVKTLAKRET